jgi:hypothetical protein
VAVEVQAVADHESVNEPEANVLGDNARDVIARALNQHGARERRTSRLAQPPLNHANRSSGVQNVVDDQDVTPGDPIVVRERSHLDAAAGERPGV